MHVPLTGYGPHPEPPVRPHPKAAPIHEPTPEDVLAAGELAFDDGLVLGALAGFVVGFCLVTVAWMAETTR